MARQRKHNGYFRKTFVYQGKRYYVYAKSQKELLEKITQRRKDLEEGHEGIINPTIDKYYDYFTELRRSEVSESTLRTQRLRYELISGVQIGAVRFGSMRIKDITRRDIETARQILLDGGKSPMNLNNCFSHLNHVFNSAVLDETIDRNPCKALKQLKRNTAPISETSHRALTEEETELFFNGARSRNSYYVNMFVMMIKTGMRVGEVSALYPVDIDRKNGFIHVRKTITRTEVGTHVVGESAKTRSGVRDIPLTRELLEVIRRQEDLNRMIHGFSSDGLLFRSADGGILREYQINREIARICKAVNVRKFTCHSFRVTFATRFIEQRPQDYKILSEIMGHKDVGITLNLYTRVMTDGKINAMNALEIKTS